MYIGLHEKYPLFWSDFNKFLIFATDFLKKYLNVKFHMKIRLVGPFSFHTDREDDADRRYSQFMERVYTGNDCRLQKLENSQ